MIKRRLLIFIFFLALSPLFAGFEQGVAENNDNIDNSIIIARIKGDDVEVTVPKIIFTFTDTDIKIKFKNPEHTRLLYNNNRVNFIINGEDTILNFVNGEVTITKRFTTSDTAIKIYSEEFSYTHAFAPIALWYIVLPLVLLLAAIVYYLMREKTD